MPTSPKAVVKYGLLLVFTVLIILGFFAFRERIEPKIVAKSASDSTQAPSASSGPAMGINLAGVTYYSSQLPFLDGFKSTRPWRVKGFQGKKRENQPQLSLDDQGWVKALPTIPSSTKKMPVVTRLYGEIDGHYPGGQYVVLYEGEGTLEYRSDAQKVDQKSEKGRELIEVTPSNRGISLTIKETDPNKTGNYLRNLRVVPLAQEKTFSSEIFNPTFIDKIQPFDALRFMNWLQTNHSPQKDWSQRPTVGDATWETEGVPIEIMVKLANRTGAAPWFTLPHLATDEYVTQFAQYVKSHLDPTLNVYVEYSNEVWNGNFEQARWVRQMAQAKGLQPMDWYSRRTTEITRIWDQVFGEDKDRVIGVMSAQAANLDTGKRVLGYHWADKPLSHRDYGIDALAIAPYFGGYLGKSENADVLEQWTQADDGGLNQLFREITQGGLLPDSPSGGALAEATRNIEQYAQFAQQEHLSLLAYEGGQHLVAKRGNKRTQALNKLFIAANRDPRMGDIYQRYLQTWYQLGGGLFMHFSDIRQPNQSGSWGALEYVNQADSPKYDALITVIRQLEQKYQKIR